MYICLCHLRDYALYTYLRKLRHSRGLGQLMGVACKRMRVRGSSSYRQARKIQKLLITVVYSRETV